MKIIFIGLTAMVVYLMMRRFHKSYDREADWFPHWVLIPPCVILGFIWNESTEGWWSPFEILWAFSIYLEAVTIMPQLVLLQRTGNVENLTSNYIVSLGGYRALYLINWIYRFLTEDGYRHWLVWIAGTVQTLLYVDFFYYYFQSRMKGTKMVLPTSV